MLFLILSKLPMGFINDHDLPINVFNFWAVGHNHFVSGDESIEPEVALFQHALLVPLEHFVVLDHLPRLSGPVVDDRVQVRPRFELTNPVAHRR